MSQDTRTITIEILTSNKTMGDSGKSTGGDSSFDEEKQFDLKKLLHPMNTLAKKVDKSLFGKTFIVTQIYSNAKQLLKSSVDVSVNRYFNMSENYLAENSYNNIKSAVGKAAGFASSVATGAMVGGPIGAGIGAVTWGVNEYLSYNNQLSSYHSSINTTVAGNRFSNIRSSLYDGGKGTEN